MGGTRIQITSIWLHLNHKFRPLREAHSTHPHTHTHTHTHTYMYIYIYIVVSCFSLPPQNIMLNSSLKTIIVYFTKRDTVFSLFSTPTPTPCYIDTSYLHVYTQVHAASSSSAHNEIKTPNKFKMTLFL